MSAFLLLFTVGVFEPKPVELPDMYSVRTGLYADGTEYCEMAQVINDVEFPGTCPYTSQGKR